jgi:hypothetical protein
MSVPFVTALNCNVQINVVLTTGISEANPADPTTEGRTDTDESRTPSFAAHAAEVPHIECRTVTRELENRKSKFSEAWVKAADGLKMVFAPLFVPVLVAPTIPEVGE